MESHDKPNEHRRKKEDYFKLSRFLLKNHYKTEKTKKRVKGAVYQISDFFTRSLWTWIRYYVESRFGCKHSYPTYGKNETGIYTLEKSSLSNKEGTCIGILSDWATDTKESHQIAAKMGSHHPDYTIHLGDTYFVGSPEEVKNNFLGKNSSWPKGSIASFALLGNHEMYARGDAFFKHLLPTLGIKNQKGIYQGQKAGFFCLESDHWLILGLDTAYHSVGKIPFFELLSMFAPDCRFDDKQMEWLEEKVKLNDNEKIKKGILILTHHQYISAYQKEGEHQKPAEQLAERIGKERAVIWLWGHEHKFSVYEKTQVENGITAYGRCIGNGGMPIELASKTFLLDSKKNGYKKLIFTDRRIKSQDGNYPLGYNGYTLVKIKNEILVIEYYDSNQCLYSETWTNQQGEISMSVNIQMISIN